MNKQMKVLCAFLLISISGTVQSGQLVTAIEQQLRLPGTLFADDLTAKNKELEKYKTKKGQLEQARKDDEARLNLLADEVRSKLDSLLQKLETDPENEYLKHLSALLTELYQTVKNRQRLKDQRIALIDDLIKILTAYVEDPQFINFQKENRLSGRLYYSFEEFQKLWEQIQDLERRVDQLNEQEKNAQTELDNAKRVLTTTAEAYKKKREEIENIDRIAQPQPASAKFEPQQQREILSVEEQLYQNKQELEASRMKIALLQQNLIAIQLFVARSRLTILREHVRRIKPAVRVSEADIVQAQEELSKKKQAHFSSKDLLNKELEQVTAIKKTKEKELDALSTKYKIMVDSDVVDWSQTKKDSPEWLEHFTQVGAAQAEVAVLQRKQEMIEAQIALEDEKFKYESMQARAKETYFKIVTRKFLNEDEITQSIKEYDTVRIDSRAAVSRNKERVALVPELLTNEKKTLDNIQKMREEVSKERGELFVGKDDKFENVMENINEAEGAVRDTVDILGKMTGLYTSVVSAGSNLTRLSDFIISELKSITFWHRPEIAISWQGVRNIVPDIVTFMGDLRSYVSRLSLNAIVGRLKNFVTQPVNFLVFLLKLFATLVLLFIARRFAQGAVQFLVQKFGQNGAGFGRTMGMLAAALLSFFNNNFWLIALWILAYASIFWQVVPDVYFYVFFYLFSIPYLLYLAYRFVRFMLNFNARHGYAFLAEDFQRRFAFVISLLLYSTTIIMLFREAFSLVNYYGSELPRILLAVNFIIFQISLILLITKEQIVNLIPQRDSTWEWIHKKVNQYFYHLQILLIAIIIMSNPYVGFGQLVLYSLVGLIYTGLLVAALIWVHNFFKRAASHLFFQQEDDAVRERFSNAKTWFGLLIIFFFLVFVFIGVIVSAKIWGWSITYSDIQEWFQKPFIGSAKGAISVKSIVTLLVFVLGGVLASYAINRYVLDKIFDLLMVDAGVQYTVTSITGYLVFVVALFLGLQSVGLGDLVLWAMAALAFSLSWILKDPIGDFIAYFVILVQRPIKIGDYVKINDEIMGVVRRITPRSVVLRRKNSTTIVVPNSYVVSHPLANWNYVRSFIAFNDMKVVIDYTEDPERARRAFMEVVENHPNILRTPKPIIRLEDFGEYGYVFLIRGFMSSSYTLDQWEIASDIRFGIAKMCQEKNIKLALPIRMLVPGNGSKKIIDQFKEMS